jgi:hypothetical protein
MAQDSDSGTPRKGKLSAFALLKSWLFDKTNPAPTHSETEFLNTRDGYELAKFAKQAFGGDAEAQRAQQEAVDAEQAEIDALLQGTGAVPMPVPVSVAPASPAAAPIAAPAAPPVAAPSVAAAPAQPAKSQVEVAVRYLEQLRGQGFSVETLAEALIIIESRDVRARSQGGG